MPLKIERLEEIENMVLGEGPHWDEENQCLLFVDIFGSSINKYDLVEKRHTKAFIKSDKLDSIQASFIIPVKGQKNKFVIAFGRNIAVIEWDEESPEVHMIKTLYQVENETDLLENKFNDGKCDPTGKLWAGTIGGFENGEVKIGKGSLYSFKQNNVQKHVSEVGLSNGLAWDEQRKKFYYVDTTKNIIDAYDFDINNGGTISNKTTIFTLKKHNINGSLDGMTIDRDGNIYVAIFCGSSILKIDPQKQDTILEKITLPAIQPTSVTFGGPNLDELYVTTGNIKWADAVPSPPNDGGTFKITGLNSKGYPGVSVVL